MRAWVWIACVFAPMSWALEFGLPEVSSEKQAPLEIRVPVTDLGAVDPSQLFPMLAPESAFFEKGIARPEVLSRLLYSIERTGSSTALVIRTLAPWVDPEFTTLVEVFTPQGAVLLPISVTVFDDDRASVAVDEPVKPALTVPAAPAQVSPTVKTLNVSDGATLWRLAARVKPESVTMEQVIVSLYETNPDAFEYGNVNALEKGTTLQVPSTERMLQTTAVDAKQVFDAHMREPKRDFRAPTMINVEAAPEPPVATPLVATRAPQVEEMAVAPIGQEVATRSVDVDALLEKISVLESKLDRVDAKLEAIAQQRPAKPEASTLAAQPPEPKVPEPKVLEPKVLEPKLPELTKTQPDSGQFNFDVASLWARVQSELPSEDEWRAFWRSELGQGTAIFLVVLALVMMMRKVYGGDAAPSIPPRESRAIRPVIEDDIPPYAPELQTDTTTNALDAGSIMADAASDPLPQDPAQPGDGDALESAIARLKSKIEDPTRLTEAEALYQEGDDSLIDAFSADALNENPEWGQDPDDEADVANHQLELARNYLEMGMTQTAIELLERVAVSPHQASAQKARALLDARGR